MDIDTDKLVGILEKNQPLSVMCVEEGDKTKLVCLFALPHLVDKITDFATKLLEENERT